MLGLVVPACAQYAGPAILSRGEAPAAMAAPKVDFSFSLALTANYTTGLAGVSAPNSQGQLADQASYGESATLGVSGAHSWKHSHLGLSYSGSFSHYGTAGYFDGLSQGLSFGLSHEFSRHINFSLRESAGMFTQFAPATVSLNSSVPFDPSQSNIPTTDFYDNRTIYSTTQMGVTIQKSSRLSFNLGVGYFVNVRRSSALYGVTGETATGDVQYRVSRRVTLGADYSFSHYSYTHSFGGTFVHTAGVTVSVRLSRWTEFSILGGFSRAESSFEQTVPIDPAILEILCPPSLVLACPLTGGTVISHQILWGPDFTARLSRSFHRGVAYVSAGESITPGNGLFLTSRMATALAGYGYSGLRKWSLNLSANYATALSLGNVAGNYGQISGSYGMSRQILKSLSLVSSFSATQYQSRSFTGYNRLIYSASVGLGFSSNNIPVRFF
jgi:hypothetical protein